MQKHQAGNGELAPDKSRLSRFTSTVRARFEVTEKTGNCFDFSAENMLFYTYCDIAFSIVKNGASKAKNAPGGHYLPGGDFA